ncbi:ATPase [Thiohalobacter thiocyanaticus]|uniref:ATPase n=1 Tax=Thiohalobacter thiocyanaticus TaxID=585455 RepID=A0A1Z4VSW8_9GAMM|nr:phage/plasmid primase, P4 family [Thiohalobacter thiocyanaticus]BAZ94294.1 ATPase [Thiohalobacter thiocyanaticus]
MQELKNPEAEATAHRAQAMDTQPNDSALAFALQLAESGLPVFPCREDKSPRTARGFHDASTDPTTIRGWWSRWPGALIGVPTGPVTDLLVIDIDPGGADWHSEHAADLACGRVHRTQRGHHLLYRHVNGVKCSAGKIAPGVDVRTDGGYVIWWPAHGLEAVGDLDDIGEAPAWLLEKLRDQKQHQSAIQATGDTIPEQTRNTTLTSLAGSMRRRGLSAEEIAPALHAINEARCRPPLDRADVDRIAASVGQYPPASEQAPAYTDAGNAQRLVAAHGEDLRYVPELGWMAWDGTQWARDELLARRKAIETARAIYNEAAALESTDDQKAAAAWAKQSQQAGRVQAALWLAQPDLAAPVDAFDRDPWIFPAINGVIDLRTGDLHPHRREYMNTRATAVYFDATALCPTWETFLARVLPDAEVRTLVQRLAGYSLTGATSEQVLAFLYGTGRNGKSVFLETLAALAGDYHTPTRIETLSAGRGAGIPNDVAALAGARLVTVSETPEGARLNESLVKDLTGGDTITARFLRREYFQFQPQFKLWIRGNHKPQIRGTDDGIWRRLLLIPFTVQIPERDVDPKLPERLRDELPGILAWAVRGCLDWQTNGLQPPEAVKAAVSTYRTEMDMLGEFIESCCVTDPAEEAPAAALYGRYREWATSNGHQPVSSMRFGLALGERGFSKIKSGTVRWRGIALSGHLDTLDTSPSSSDSRARDPVNAGIVSELSNCPQCDGEGCPWCGGGA